MHTHIPITPPSWASLPSSLCHPSRSSQSTKPISLCYAASSHQPTILHSVLYIYQCYSHFTPDLLSHPISSIIFSISLFLPCNWVHQYHFFLKIPYICVSIRYLFFSSWLTSLCVTDSKSIHLTTNNSISFLFMAECGKQPHSTGRSARCFVTT